MALAPNECAYCDSLNPDCGFCDDGKPLDTQEDWDNSWGGIYAPPPSKGVTMASRKDYEMIARTIASLTDEIERQFSAGMQDQIFRNGYQWGLSDLASELAYKLKEDNPNFDRDKFLYACEGKYEG